LRNGEYADPVKSDELASMSEQVINRYYGVEGRPKKRKNGQFGAGHPTDEDVLEYGAAEDVIGDEQDAMEIDEDYSEIMDIDGTPDPMRLEQMIHEHVSKNTNSKAARIAPHRRPFPELAQVQSFMSILLQVQERQLDVQPRARGRMGGNT
jgi:hypothetical protein